MKTPKCYTWLHVLVTDISRILEGTGAAEAVAARNFAQQEIKNLITAICIHWSGNDNGD